VAVPEVTTHLRISISPFSQRTRVFAVMMTCGFLFGSRVIVTKEARTSPSIEELIIAAAGVDDLQWEGASM
jgi:enoyl reductase-like protein